VKDGFEPIPADGSLNFDEGFSLSHEDAECLAIEMIIRFEFANGEIGRARFGHVVNSWGFTPTGVDEKKDLPPAIRRVVAGWPLN
jgi:hypothetical protein